VLLSANAFVGALRAIALALASSPDVLVRPSRRETAMAALLLEGAPGLFQLVTELVPAPGEHLWAYGTARTLESLRHELPSGVVLHPHGPGIGLVALDLQAHPEETSNWAEGLALDTVLLDQRGCLSPRIVALRGTVEACQRFAASLAAKLSRWEHDCPRGSLSALERGEELRYRDTLLYAGDVLPAGKGGLGLQFDGTGTLVLPPATRWLHLLRADDPLRTLEPLAPHATTLALGGLAASELERGPFRHTRLTLPGSMQRPRFDGPVDKRGASEGEVL